MVSTKGQGWAYLFASLCLLNPGEGFVFLFFVVFFGGGVDTFSEFNDVKQPTLSLFLSCLVLCACSESP